MDREGRIDDFKGTDVAYIHYLETQLEESRCHVSQLCQSLQRPHVVASPPDSFAELLDDGPDSTPRSALQNQRSAPGSLDLEVLNGAVHANNNLREELKFIEYDVTKEKSRNEKPQWRTEIDKLLADVPVASRWVGKREDLDLSGAQNHLAMAVLLRRPWMVTPPSSDSCQSRSLESISNSLLDCAKIYANATRDSQCLARFATNLALLQELVLVSLCVVLVAIGVDEDHVDSVMKLCWANEKKQEKEPDKKTLQRNRRGALWVNRCIGKLSASGWGFRSTEIFLLCARSVNMYGRFSDFTQESFSLFTDWLLDPKYTSPYQETPDWLSYNIPCIIKRQFGDVLELREICEILGYSETASALFADLPLEYDRCVQSTVSVVCFQKVVRTHSEKRSVPFSPQSGKRRRQVKTVKRTNKGTNKGTKRTPKEAPKKKCQEISTDHPQNIPVDAQPLTELPIQRPLDSSLADVTGFDARSMMAMGFDMTSMMEMGFDMSSVMEPGSLLPFTDSDSHQDKVRLVEGNGIEPPAWTSTSPIVMGAS